jgi:aminoglycoside phosphotransferase (APT) family kinase protein
MCTLGDPLTDLGTALAYWVDPQDPEDFQEIRSAPTTLPGTLTRAQLSSATQPPPAAILATWFSI